MKKKELVVLLGCIAMLGFSGCKDSTPPAPSAPAPGPGPAAPIPSFDLNNKVNMYQDVLNRDPKNLNALIGLGNVLMDAGRFPEAVDAYGKALEIEPSDVNVRTDMGTCFRRIGRPEKAVEAYRQSLTYQPTHSQTLANLGIVLLYDLNRGDEALEAWEKLLEVDPAHRMADQVRQEVARLKAVKK